VFKLGIRNDLGRSYKWHGFGLKGQRSTLGLGLTAIRRGFELYECLLVVVFDAGSRCDTRGQSSDQRWYSTWLCRRHWWYQQPEYTGRFIHNNNNNNNNIALLQTQQLTIVGPPNNTCHTKSFDTQALSTTKHNTVIFFTFFNRRTINYWWWRQLSC